MPDDALDGVIAQITGLLARWGPGTTVAQMRRDYEAFYRHDQVPAETTPVLAGGVAASWVEAPGARQGRVALYCHGGGYHIGSVASHHGLIARVSAAATCRILALDYRLAPEHRFPAPLEDALAAYDWLLAQGHGPEGLAFIGDSAGGGLVLAALLALRDRGAPLPAAAVVMSPWTDLDATSETYVSQAASDPLSKRDTVLAMARSYLGRQCDPHNPLAAPLHGELSGLPPLLIQSGERDILLDDSRLFAAKAKAAGVEVELDLWEGMIHVFQLFGAELPEARDAIAAIGAFLKARLV